MLVKIGKNLDKIRNIRVAANSEFLCLLCKSGRMLCGKAYCPILFKLGILLKHKEIFDLDIIEGSSPPSIFVGRLGYPKVYLGPLIPPFHGDTALLDSPENWVGKSIDEIVNFRFSLVWGRFSTDVYEANKSGRLLSLVQELAMGCKPVDGEVIFFKKPSGKINLDSSSQPFGPSAPLKSFKVSNVSVDRNIETCYYDHDLKACDALWKLYNVGVPVSKIQYSLSLGMLGKSGSRRIVPTRWSITAVDNVISNSLINEIKHHDTFSEYRVYTFKNLDNLFVAVFMPGSWSFEWIEAWFPGTVWNLRGNTPQMMGDFEGYDGRTTYASVGGCYYAARLAVAEALKKERRQASVLVLREIYTGYLLPVGVWNVRESLRHALKHKPKTFFSIKEAINHAFGMLSIPLREWIKTSYLLRKAILQKKMTDFW